MKRKTSTTKNIKNKVTKKQAKKQKKSAGREGASDEEEDEKPPTVTMKEKMDKNALMHMFELEIDDSTQGRIEDLAVDIISMHKAKVAMPRTMKTVVYAPSEYAEGRLYGNGLQSIAGWVRRFLSYKYYHDIDMVNCGPALLLHIVETKLGVRPPLLYEYVVDRQGCFDRIRLANPQCVGLSDKQMKKLFLIGVHGGKHTSPVNLKKAGLSQDFPCVDELVLWERSIRKLSRKLMVHPDYSKLSTDIENNQEKYNKAGTFVSCVWQELENKVLLHLVKFFHLNTRHVPGVLVFDGLQVERVDGCMGPMDEGIIRAAEVSVVAAFSIKHFALLEKSLVPTAEDWAIYWGPKDLYRIADVFKRYLYVLTRDAHARGLKRYGKHTMKPHARIPGVYVQDMEADDFINVALSTHDTEWAQTRPMTKLVAWFNENDHPRFERLTDAKMRRDVISFTDGYFDIHSMLFTEWSDATDPPLTNHYFDRAMFPDGCETVRDTPMWTDILKTQLVADDMVDIFEVLVGRLFYDVGTYDNWQLMLYIKGLSGTGKSTLVQLVSMMFPAGSVGAISSNQEQQFGLEALHTKRLVQLPDIPKKMSKVLAQELWQSMCSGENVSIPGKHKVAKTDVRWTAPLMGAANCYFDYEDKCGQVARRMGLFHFDIPVPTTDGNLKTKIIRDELDVVMLRCIAKYRQKSDLDGWRDFDSVCPDVMRQDRGAISVATNPLAAFIANGDDIHQVVFKEGSITSLTRLSMIFSRHMLNVHKKHGASIGDDYQPITSAGFVQRVKNVCKICDQPVSIVGCAGHYDAKNRLKRTVFENMEIIIKDY
jgi:hypothetical protein